MNMKYKKIIKEKKVIKIYLFPTNFKNEIRSTAWAQNGLVVM